VEAARHKPPLKQMLAMGLPIGAGTDGTRVASYHPWTCLWWMATGKTIGGIGLQKEADRLNRLDALRLYTHGSAWFSGENERKGILAVGHYADLAVLSDDYFAVEDDVIRGIESVLTLVGGRIVYAAEEFSSLCPALPPVSPDWSPIGRFGGYDNSQPVPPVYQHTPIMSADGRVWEAGCGCS
jgi:hypothetical protein